MIFACQSTPRPTITSLLTVTCAFLRLVSLGLASSNSQSWVGRPPASNSCHWCRIDIVKTVATLTSELTRAVVSCQVESQVPPAETYPLIRGCVLSLHHMVNTDPGFLVALGNSPSVQRNYIWTVKVLDEMLKPALNLSASEADVLSELVVDYDQ